MTHLHIAPFTMAGVEQRPHLEFVELDAEYPVLRGAPERPEAVPTGHRLADVFRAHLRTRYVFVNIHRLVAMVLFSFRCGTEQIPFNTSLYRTISITLLAIGRSNINK